MQHEHLGACRADHERDEAECGTAGHGGNGEQHGSRELEEADRVAEPLAEAQRVEQRHCGRDAQKLAGAGAKEHESQSQSEHGDRRGRSRPGPLGRWHIRHMRSSKSGSAP